VGGSAPSGTWGRRNELRPHMKIGVEIAVLIKWGLWGALPPVEHGGDTMSFVHLTTFAKTPIPQFYFHPHYHQVWVEIEYEKQWRLEKIWMY